MYPGKNDMPCSNTIAEREYDGGGSYTPEEEDRIEEIKHEKAMDKLVSDEDPTFFWDAISVCFYDADSPLKMLIIKGDDESLLKAGKIIRQSAIEYTKDVLKTEVWNESLNPENAEF